MFKTLGVVEVASQEAADEDRLGMENLLERRIGGQSLVGWVARRVTEAQMLDAVVIVASDSLPCERIRQLAPPDVPVFVGRQSEALGRLAGALRRFPSKGIVRVGLRHAFVDPVLIDRLIAAAATAEYDYVGFRSSEGCPSLLSRIGMFAEWFRGAAIERASREAVPGRDSRCPTRFMLAHPDRFRLRLASAPTPLDRPDLRLALEVEEDWRHAHEIIDALGPEDLDWQSIAGLLDRQPAMRQRMAELNEAIAPEAA